MVFSQVEEFAAGKLTTIAVVNLNKRVRNSSKASSRTKSEMPDGLLLRGISVLRQIDRQN